MIEINSRNNITFRKWLGLFNAQGVKKQGLTFITGRKQTQEILRDFPDRCEAILSEKHRGKGGLKNLPEIPHYLLSSSLFREIDIYGTGDPILLLRVETLSAWDAQPWPPGCTLFVPFQDPANVGAVIRSAAAFGASRVIALKEAAHPFHHKSVRVAGSAILRIPLYEGPSIGDLGSADYPIITLSTEGTDLGDYEFPSSFGLLPGLEGPGIPSGLKSLKSLSIPMSGGVESLNAALAAGIALYVWRNSLRKSDTDVLDKTLGKG